MALLSLEESSPALPPCAQYFPAQHPFPDPHIVSGRVVLLYALELLHSYPKRLLPAFVLAIYPPREGEGRHCAEQKFLHIFIRFCNNYLYPYHDFHPTARINELNTFLCKLNSEKKKQATDGESFAEGEH